MRTGWPYLDDPAERHPGAVLAFAHRGGATTPGNEGRENTLPAFARAVAQGYRYLETDVHLTADGHLVAFHDAALDRLTDGTGPLAARTLAEVRRLRVGADAAVPTLAELLDAFPEARLNVDLKGRGTERALADLVAARELHDRLLVASFDVRRIRRFRHLTRSRVATAASPVEVALLATQPARVARRLLGPTVAAVQVPARRGPLPVVTALFCRRMHAAGVQVHVWTLDDATAIEAALAAGVDGVFTDRTDILKDVLSRCGRWDAP